MLSNNPEAFACLDNLLPAARKAYPPSVKVAKFTLNSSNPSRKLHALVREQKRHFFVLDDEHGNH